MFVASGSPAGINGGRSTFSNPPAYIRAPARSRPPELNHTTMYKHTCVLLLALAAVSATGDNKSPKQTSPDDPFALMDRLVHYVFPPRMKLWPWYDLFSAANPLEDPKLISNRDKCEIDLFVKRFAPTDLKVRVKHRYVTIEGRRKENNDDAHFMVNRFVQNFALPAGCKEDEVVAVYENGVLSISAPKHELPPPPPEREVPIEVRTPVEVQTTTEKKEEVIETVLSTSQPPLDQLDTIEATTHVGKIRKKELKTTTKTTKENEVIKEDNRLDMVEVE